MRDRWGRSRMGELGFCAYPLKIEIGRPHWRRRPNKVQTAVLLSKGRLRRFQRNPIGPAAMDMIFRRSGSENNRLLELSYMVITKMTSILFISGYVI